MGQTAATFCAVSSESNNGAPKVKPKVYLSVGGEQLHQTLHTRKFLHFRQRDPQPQLLHHIRGRVFGLGSYHIITFGIQFMPRFVRMLMQ